MSGQDRTPCGAHPDNAFDHTCEDCMLPEPHLDPGDTPRRCEAGCPNPIQRWHDGRGLCTPHWFGARQYLYQPEVAL